MNLWKRKLLAYLHDPPSKCLDLGAHRENSGTLMSAAGFSEEEINAYNRSADHTASAADRLPFPNSQASGLSCVFDGVRASFHHPLGGEALRFHKEFESAELAFETDQTIQPVADVSQIAEEDQWRARFFAHWRFYSRNARERDYRFAFLPADTRIPDHTVWTHMQIVSALAGCATGDAPGAPIAPAFLRFQIGPVQEFIAQARSIRDLWSGSYLLSWLMAAGLKELSSLAGPDAVIFPNLSGQPLFDLHWRDELWKQIRFGEAGRENRFTGWDSLNWPDAALLTPNLPNVFLAVIPASQAADWAKAVERAIRNEWGKIGKAVWHFAEEAGMFPENESSFTNEARQARFQSQIERFLSISWRATPWPEKMEDALRMSDFFAPEMPIQEARQRVAQIIKFAQETMPVEHRDRRFYEDDSRTRLNNVGLAWSVLLALNSWELDAVRQTRSFAAWTRGGWEVGTFSNKDSLSGKEEAVAGGRNWKERAENLEGIWKSLFKKEDWLGAVALVKRLWHAAYLEKVWGLKTDSKNFPMPNTRGLAAHEPFENRDEEEGEEGQNSEKYFAVLAFDGDEIGKWVSGQNTPEFDSQLADYTDGSGNPGFGSKPYVATRGNDLLKSRRPVSPSYHLQVSEALSNFALKCARPIVEVFDGRLIYAGGDDVLALLPADTALDCAQALSKAFRGEKDLGEFLQSRAKKLRATGKSKFPQDPDFKKLAIDHRLFGSTQQGFLSREDNGGEALDNQNRPIPFIVPGPKASASVGIAMAHFNSPLQDTVREAQRAEKRAKSELRRSAVAITLLKRSGEIVHWGCKWESGGLELYDAVFEALNAEEFTAKFPHRVAELLTPYLSRSTGISRIEEAEEFRRVCDEIIEKEFGIACERQKTPRCSNETLKQVPKLLRGFLGKLGNAGATPEQKLKSVIDLCQTVAFAHRTAPVSNNNNSDPKGTA